MRFSIAIVMALAACAAMAQSAGFRDRVVQLALIYGESSGIDPQGFKVQAREVSRKEAGCADVEVVTTRGDEVVRRETVRACRHGRPRPAPG